MFIAKRIFKIIGFLALVVIIYAVGAYLPADYDSLITPTPLPPPTPMLPVEIDPVYTDLGTPALIEYGYPALISNNNDPFHAYVRYPQAGNPTDVTIFEWAFSLYYNMAVDYSTGVELGPADFGELNVHFDSYLIDNRYASIHQFGEYSYTTTELPQEINKTFNIDLTEYKFLEPKDILDFENIDSVLSLLNLRMLVEHPRTDGYLDFMDERWLSYLLITHEGIVVFLPHAEFLPDSFDSLTVTLPYDALGSLLLIRRDAPLPTMPTPAPSPTPDPTPTPEPTPTPDPDGDSDTNGDGDGDDDGDGGDDGDQDADGNGDDDDQIEETPPPEIPYQSGRIDPEKPIIALSFDDGPGIYTELFLDLLEEYGVRATFFTVGNLVHTRSDTLKRAVDIGCEVAGHSWNHKNLAKMNADDVQLQIETTQSAIEAITGTTVPFFRPPYAAVSESMKTVSAELGLSMITWNVDPEDWRDTEVDTIYQLVMEQVKDKAIILSHDIYETTLEAYRLIIPELLLQGYQIVTVSELLKLTEGKLIPGDVYYSGDRFVLTS